ncbi:unnamed protein product, partial [Scytosiphon promiscuus]
MDKPLAIGDRIDCLDYFVSSQTQVDAKKWREAEVVYVRHGDTGTEVLVRFLRWSSKWNRWISFTQEPERFAPYLSRAPKAVERST